MLLLVFTCIVLPVMAEPVEKVPEWVSSFSKADDDSFHYVVGMSTFRNPNLAIKRARLDCSAALSSEISVAVKNAIEVFDGITTVSIEGEEKEAFYSEYMEATSMQSKALIRGLCTFDRWTDSTGTYLLMGIPVEDYERSLLAPLKNPEESDLEISGQFEKFIRERFSEGLFFIEEPEKDETRKDN